MRLCITAILLSSIALMLPAGVKASSKMPVALLAAEFPEFTSDVQKKLDSFGDLSITAFDATIRTPTPDDLASFRALLVWSDMPYRDPSRLGDVLADYVDNGGGVVVAMFSWTKPYGLNGRYVREGYGSFLPDAEPEPYREGELGRILMPSHPIVEGVSTLRAGSFRATSNKLNPGARAVAEWDDGAVMVALRDTPPRRTVDLGFFPPSSDVCRAPRCGWSSWDSSTDGARIIHNALIWVAGMPPVPPQGLHITGYEGSDVLFDLSGAYDPDGHIVAYEWDFDGDGVFESTSGTPIAARFFGDDFHGEIWFRLTDNEGLQAEDFALVDVINVAPVVRIISVEQPIPEILLAGDTVVFTGDYKDEGIMDTHVTSWTFGDGLEAGDSLVVAHTFDTAGDYPVTLTVVDDDGARGTATVTVRVMTVDQATRVLCDSTASLGIQAGVEKSLLTKCFSAVADLAADRTQNAGHHLVAMRNQAEALEGKRGGSPELQIIVGMATAILARL